MKLVKSSDKPITFSPNQERWGNHPGHSINRCDVDGINSDQQDIQEVILMCGEAVDDISQAGRGDKVALVSS